MSLRKSLPNEKINYDEEPQLTVNVDDMKLSFLKVARLNRNVAMWRARANNYSC